MNIEFAVWVALFAGISSLVGTTIHSVLQYLTNKNNNQSLLKKTELELNHQIKSDLIKSKRDKLIEAILNFNEFIPNYQGSSFANYCKFWGAYFNVYVLVTDETKSELDTLKSYFDKHPTETNFIKNSEFTLLINKINKCFFDEISNLEK